MTGSRQGILRTLFVALGSAVLLVAWLRPRAQLAPWEDLGLVLAIQVAAILGARTLVAQGRGYSVIKALMSALLFAAVVVFALRPSVGASFDEVFLAVAFVEFAAFVAAGYAVRSGPSE